MGIKRWLAMLGAAAVVVTLASCLGDSDNSGPVAGVTVQTLSTRADFVSGGNALVEVKFAAGVTKSKLKVTVNGADETAAFTPRADGRTVGLLTGLVNGPNAVNATATDGSFNGATLTITNHPIGGPVLLSKQITPWVCATPAPVAQSGNTPATNASGLPTVATDAQCDIATQFTLFYRTTTAGCVMGLPDPSPPTAAPTNPCFKPYTANSTPADLASTTVNGKTMPYIVRVERGTINRGIYDIAVLFNPAAPWTPNAPQAQWNGKVVYSFGASTGQPYRQYRTEQNWADDTSLSRGFMVVDNSLSDSLYNSSRVLNAETVMMMKEHIVDNYGEIFYTAGNGCSGGSIGQNTVASIYPGLLDGIQVTCDFPDSATTGIEVTDCVLLVNFYASASWATLETGLTQAQINAKKTAINGHLDQTGCASWNNDFGSNNKPGNYIPTYVLDAAGDVGPLPGAVPTNNCQLPAALVYDPATNPTGPRCGDPDLAVAVWGTAPGTTRANEITDNVGVQYGFKALLAGAITPEEFVTLNEKIGGVDADSNLTAARAVADPAGLTIAYTAGMVSSGAQLAKLPIIDIRGWDETGIHYIWRSFSERARLDQDGGGHGNDVLWQFGTALTAPAASGLTLLSFNTMDSWLTTMMTTTPKTFVNGAQTSAQVLAAKPATAFDFCYLSTDTTFSTMVTNLATCAADPRLMTHSSPHQVAGGPLTENILKCTLKPLNLADYTGITFTATQQSRLQAAFSGGVCDWTKPGVGQTAAISPLTFAAGPGGVPFPAAPQSTAL